MRFLKLSSGCFGTPELGNRTMPVLDLTNGTDPSLDYHFEIAIKNLFTLLLYPLTLLGPTRIDLSINFRSLDTAENTVSKNVVESIKIIFVRRISVEQNKRASIEGIDEVSATIGTTGSDEERFRIRASKRRERSRYVKIERGTEREGSEGGTS